MRFLLPSIKCPATPRSFRLLPSTVSLSELCSTIWLPRVVGGWEEPPNIWLTVTKNAFVGWALNFRVHMLLKSAVKTLLTPTCAIFLRMVYDKKRASVRFLSQFPGHLIQSEDCLPYKSFLFSLDDQKLARTVWAEPEYKTDIKEASVD